jgi:CheY-like chemotaxis protein
MSKKTKILIVEDNAVNLELFIDILSLTDYEYLTARSGEEAIEIALKEQPNVILLDIQLPSMDGITVAKILREREETRGCKIIALTAHAMKGDRENFIRLGFDGYISKPIVVKEFLREIEIYAAE